MLNETKDAILQAIAAQCKRIATNENSYSAQQEAGAVQALVDAWYKLPDEVPTWQEHVLGLKLICRAQPACTPECPMYGWCEKYLPDAAGAKCPADWEV